MVMEKDLLNFVEHFMHQEELIPLSGRSFVAVSAGVDSMVLLHLMSRLRTRGLLKDLVVLHVNHLTREQCGQEAKLVAAYAEKLGITDVRIHEWQEREKQDFSNFESRARKVRQQFFSSQLKEGDVLALGHNLDDSFEWSLLQTFKSGRVFATKGIEAKNQALIRPLIAVSKDEIRSYSKKWNVPYLEDSSNEDIRFERNFLRQKILPILKERFPQILEQFQSRSHELKDLEKMVERRTTDLTIYRGECHTLVSVEGVVDLQQFLHQEISRLSQNGRGKIYRQKAKLEKLLKERKIFGPMNFSGGVEAVGGWGWLYLSKVKMNSNENSLPEQERAYFQEYSLSEAEELFKYSLEFKSHFFPFKIIVKENSEDFYFDCLPNLLEKWQKLIKKGQLGKEKKFSLSCHFIKST